MSRLNAMKHGVFVDGVMKSMGPRCPFLASCSAMRDQELAAACVPGESCPAESAFYRQFTSDAAATYSSAREWLAEPTFTQTIHDLAITELQKQRLSALIARDGVVRSRIHPISGVTYGLEPTLAAGRYEAALANRWNDRMSKLLTDPREGLGSESTD